MPYSRVANTVTVVLHVRLAIKLFMREMLYNVTGLSAAAAAAADNDDDDDDDDDDADDVCLFVCTSARTNNSPSSSPRSAVQRSVTSIKQMLLDWCRSKVKGYKVCLALHSL